MKEVFADTSYFVALFDPNDEWHSRAIEVEKQVSDYRVVTTEFVIVEILNYFSRSRPEIRVGIVDTVHRILDDAEIDTTKCSHDAVLSGLALYEARPDKSYSLTDRISMNLMRERGIHVALTHDGNFKQEGFIVLLRKDTQDPEP